MNDKWLITRTRYIPAIWPLLSFFSWPVRKFFNLSSSGHIINVWDNGSYLAIWEKEKMKEFGLAAFSLISSRLHELSLVREEGVRAGVELLDYVKESAETSEKWELKTFAVFFDELSARYPELMKYNMCYWLFAGVVVEEKVKEVLKNYSQEDQVSISTIMLHAETPSYSEVEEQDFAALVELVQKKGIDSVLVKESLESFAGKYFWFPYEYVGPAVWTPETVRARVEKSLREAEVKKDTHHKTQKQVIDEFNLSPQAVEVFLVAQTLGLMQDDRKMYNAQVSFYINNVIAENLAKKMEISRDDARFVDREIIESYMKDKKTALARIESRKKFFVVDQIDEGHIASEGEKAQSYLESLGVTLAHEDLTKEVRGQIAFKGKVFGRVRVLHSSQVSDFNPGDIIVTGMTTPDFVPLIKLAGAIVTDEGGITCHAAIVARELKKPCVIGTKVATKVFKDGDLVEVDAEKGVVKILA